MVCHWRSVFHHSCLSLEVSLSSQWSVIGGQSHHIGLSLEVSLISGLSLEVSLSSQWSVIGGHSFITVVCHWRSVSHHSDLSLEDSLIIVVCHWRSVFHHIGLSLEVSLSSQWSVIGGQSFITEVSHNIGLSSQWSLITVVSHRRFHCIYRAMVPCETFRRLSIVIRATILSIRIDDLQVMK